MNVEKVAVAKFEATSKNKVKAAFLDRDGVINVNHGYVSTINDFEFISGVFEACNTLKEKGYQLIIITNQSGIGRGYYTEEQFHHLTQWMKEVFSENKVPLDGVYYCPHHSVEGLGKYKISCDCRKPKPGMLLAAINDHNIDLNQSILVGDNISDLEAGISAGIRDNYLITEDPNKFPSNKIITKSFHDLKSLVNNLFN